MPKIKLNVYILISQPYALFVSRFASFPFQLHRAPTTFLALILVRLLRTVTNNLYMINSQQNLHNEFIK